MKVLFLPSKMPQSIFGSPNDSSYLGKRMERLFSKIIRIKILRKERKPESTTERLLFGMRFGQ
jgi:hypothetical protein